MPKRASRRFSTSGSRAGPASSAANGQRQDGRLGQRDAAMTVLETQRTRKFWGWGYEGEGLTDAEVEDVGREMRGRFGVEPWAIAPPPALDSLNMPEPRLDPPRSMESMFSQVQRERAVHTLGKSYEDLVRG